MKLLKTSLLFCFLMLGFLAQAENSNHPLMTPEEQEIQTRARKKLYPGGRDEEPLKVQEQLPQANRKVGPATEVPQEDPSND